MNGVGRKLLMAALPVLMLLAGAELAVRLGFGGLHLVAGGPLGWTVLPELEGATVGGFGDTDAFVVSTNADGLRTPLGRDRSPGQVRVMMLGESRVFGWGVADEETLPARLDTLLGDGVEVINAGQPGYSSWQMARLAEAALPAYRPDLVLWVQPWNDFEPASAPDQALLPVHEATLASRPLWSRSHLLLLLRQPPAARQARPTENPLFALETYEDGAGDLVRVNRAERSDVLTGLQALVRAHDATLAVVLIARGANTPEEGDPLLQRFASVSADASAMGLPVVDLTQELLGRAPEDVGLRGDIGHFTADATTRLAVRLGVQLRELGFVPTP